MLIRLKKITSKKNIDKIYSFVVKYFEEIDKIKLNKLIVLKGIKNNLSNKKHLYFYIMFENKKIGLIHLYLGNKYADLCLIYILPQFRNSQIGKNSLKKILKILNKKGIKKIIVEISKSNKLSLNFFKKNLFKNFKTNIKSYIYEVNLQ
jgi:ribosomal protein S18 acetylase RimI-like enzyme